LSIALCVTVQSPHLRRPFFMRRSAVTATDR
jgi:hypothetical protein